MWNHRPVVSPVIHLNFPYNFFLILTFFKLSYTGCGFLDRFRKFVFTEILVGSFSPHQALTITHVLLYQIGQFNVICLSVFWSYIFHLDQKGKVLALPIRIIQAIIPSIYVSVGNSYYHSLGDLCLFYQFQWFYLDFFFLSEMSCFVCCS